MPHEYDVLIIGCGVVGSAVARELSRYDLRIAALDKEPDVIGGTSGRNSGVLHAGFNNKHGSKMARYCVEGNQGFDQTARELDIPYHRTGKLVVGFSEEDREKLAAMKAAGDKNGCRGLELVDEAFIREKAPYVRGKYALYSGSTAVLDPFAFTIAQAENAAHNGVEHFLSHEVTALRWEQDGYTVETPQRTFRTRWIVNSAGLFADRISAMLGIPDYKIYPCRGEYIIFDRRMGAMLPLPAYPVPDPKSGGLGIHLTPSVEGNIFVGPSNEYLPKDSAEDYGTTRSVLDMLVEDGSRIFPYLRRDSYIRTFAGVRPKLAPPGEGGFRDFVIERRPEAPHAVNLVGIESPGLTSSGPIAREVVRLIEELEPLTRKSSFDPIRRGIVTFADKSPAEQAALIARDPDYGEIVCRCGSITKAEVLAAIRNPLGVATFTGIKTRCKVMMGRCQGGYCQTRIAQLLMQETGVPAEELLYQREGSYLFTGRAIGE